MKFTQAAEPFENSIERRVKRILHKDYNYPHVSSMYISIVLYETKEITNFGNVGVKGPLTTGNPVLWKPLEAGRGTWISTTKPNIYFVLWFYFLPQEKDDLQVPSGPSAMCAINPLERKKKKVFSCYFSFWIWNRVTHSCDRLLVLLMRKLENAGIWGEKSTFWERD